MKTCSIEGCANLSNSRGWCKNHYWKWSKYGDPTFITRNRPGTGGRVGVYRARKENGRRIFAHVEAAEKALGKRLPKGAVVHHVNGDGSDNRNENLVVCPSTSYHMLIHQRQDALDACGHADWLKCSYCKQYDDPKKMYVRPDKHSANHRACLNAYQKGKQ